MITCKICNIQFKNSITWKHLKTHDMTTQEYKKLYGNDSLVSEEFRKECSNRLSGENNPNFNNTWTDAQKENQSKKLSGKTPWNKGQPLKEETKELLSLKAIERNKQWAETNSHPRQGAKLSAATKNKIKQSRKLQVIKPESIAKAIETKIRKGYDLAFFKGKKHSKESLEKIRNTIRKNARDKQKKSIDKILENLKSINVEIIGNPVNSLIELKCNNCDSAFSITKQYTMGKKFKNNLCPTCFPRDIISSQAEQELANWIKSYNIPILTNNRQLLKTLEIDILIPSHNLAIEYNGLYWHGELNGKDSSYHLYKTNACKEKGIKLITIFEDEWIHKKDIVKSRILNLLGLTQNKIHARKCQIQTITSKLANDFLNKNHIQGSGRSNICYGAFYNNQLVAVMTFSKSNISRKNINWEIDRFCSILDTSIVGIASKIFKQFIKDNNPSVIISFADKRWSHEGFYTKLGFKIEKETPPNYWYFMPSELKRYHRFSLRKNKSDDQTLTEWENRQLQGWDRIWDCGNIKYIWKKH